MGDAWFAEALASAAEAPPSRSTDGTDGTDGTDDAYGRERARAPFFLAAAPAAAPTPDGAAAPARVPAIVALEGRAAAFLARALALDGQPRSPACTTRLLGTLVLPERPPRAVLAGSPAAGVRGPSCLVHEASLPRASAAGVNVVLAAAACTYTVPVELSAAWARALLHGLAPASPALVVLVACSRAALVAGRADLRETLPARGIRLLETTAVQRRRAADARACAPPFPPLAPPHLVALSPAAALLAACEDAGAEASLVLVLGDAPEDDLADLFAAAIAACADVQLPHVAAGALPAARRDAEADALYS